MEPLKNIFLAIFIPMNYFIMLNVKCILANPDLYRNPKLLLISFDGFRWDYLDLVKQNGRLTPNFDYIVNHGVTIENGGVKNAFVTKTFPNHYSIVTGMYEENHGVVGNSMYDPKYNKSSDIGHGLPEDSFWFNNGTNVSSNAAEPIWITNQQQSTEEYPKQTGVYFWPGSEIEIQGMRPSFYKHYDKTVPFDNRVDQIVEWFQRGLINLGLLYFHEPDSTGHTNGPNSTEIVDKIVELDGTLGQLRTGLDNLTNKINIIITSDHGMAEILPKNVVNLTVFLPPTKDYVVVASSVIVNIFPRGNETTKKIYESLKKHEPLNHFKVYLKQDIPPDYHYRFNRRIGSIVVVADEGWLFNDQPPEKGDHGYNNSLVDMHPIFIATGPAFLEGKTVRQFNIVDIYSLICHILKLKPSPNDGSFKNVKQLLKSNQITYTMVIVVVLLCIVSLILLIGLYWYCHPKKPQNRNRKSGATEKVQEDGSSEGLLESNAQNEAVA